MSHSKHEAPKGFLYGAWAVTAITGFAFATMAGFGIYNVTQSQIEASTASGVQVKEVKVNVDEQAFGGGTSSVVQKGSTTDTSAECKGTKIAINNYPGDALAKEKTNKFFIDAMGGKNYRCTNVCNNSGKSNDEFIKSLKISGQPVNTVSTGAELVTMVQQEPAKVASTVVLSSTKNECQGPISEEYAGLTDGNGEAVGVWKKNTTGEDTAKQQAASQSGTDVQDAARPAEGGKDTALKIDTTGKTSGTSGSSGTKPESTETKQTKTTTQRVLEKTKNPFEKCTTSVNLQIQVLKRWTPANEDQSVRQFGNEYRAIKKLKNDDESVKKCNDLLSRINSQIKRQSINKASWGEIYHGGAYLFDSNNYLLPYFYGYKSDVAVGGRNVADAIWIPSSGSGQGYWSMRIMVVGTKGVYYRQYKGSEVWTEFDGGSVGSRLKELKKTYYDPTGAALDLTRLRTGSKSPAPSKPAGVPLGLVN